jgi:hypothetical protein
MNSEVKFNIRLMTLREQLDCSESFQPESPLQIEEFFNYLFDLISIISNEFAKEFRENLSPTQFEEIAGELEKIKSIIKIGIVLVRFGKDGNQVSLISWFKVKKFPEISKKIKTRIQKVSWIILKNKIKALK